MFSLTCWGGIVFPGFGCIHHPNDTTVWASLISSKVLPIIVAPHSDLDEMKSKCLLQGRGARLHESSAGASLFCFAHFALTGECLWAPAFLLFSPPILGSITSLQGSLQEDMASYFTFLLLPLFSGTDCCGILLCVPLAAIITASEMHFHWVVSHCSLMLGQWFR